MIEKTVLAIDPGTSKCGLALVQRDSEGHLQLIWHSVVPTVHIIPKIHEAYTHREFHLIIVGGGTHSNQVISTIRDQLPAIGILEVDEENTTLQARERYWENTPRKGWRRFLPATLQVPPAPVDDFVALILAERVLLEA